MDLRVNRERLAGLSPAARKEAEGLLAELEAGRQSNPLAFFEPHSVQQRAFFEAGTKVVAAFAGNRFGKTTSLVVRSLLECVDRDVLPERLRGFKRFEAPAAGWIVAPTTDKIYDSLIPAFQKWCPRSQFRGGKWDGAWSKERRQLSFANGSQISFKTYEQDASTLGGAALHFVGYDEPPPRAHREECLTRLLDYGGYEMFAMTPLKTNTGWIRRDIFKNREAPHITVVRGSMHDNPLLDEETKRIALASYQNDLWRRAREFGDFVEVGGLIYAEFERAVVPAFDPGFVRGLDVVVGIDPGIRNAAFVWVGFDSDNVAHVFDEALLQDKTPSDYVQLIRSVNARWGLSEEPAYVIDPAARARAQVNAESVETELVRQGLFVMPGQNQVEAGVQQVRVRLQHGRLKVGENCRGLRDEADDYAAEDREDGQFKPIKEHDHRLDALRYAVMFRAWDPVVEEQAPQRTLGYVQDFDPGWTPVPPANDAPLGAWS